MFWFNNKKLSKLTFNKLHHRQQEHLLLRSCDCNSWVFFIFKQFSYWVNFFTRWLQLRVVLCFFILGAGRAGNVLVPFMYKIIGMWTSWNVSLLSVLLTATFNLIATQNMVKLPDLLYFFLSVLWDVADRLFSPKTLTQNSWSINQDPDYVPNDVSSVSFVWVIFSVNRLTPGKEAKITDPWHLILIYVALRFLQGGGTGGIGLLNNIKSFLWIKIQQFTSRTLQVQLFAHLHRSDYEVQHTIVSILPNQEKSATNTV